MKLILGLDTSCYTTSAALLNMEGEIVADERRLLAVPSGGRGLRQQEIVFQHTATLPELFARAMDRAPAESVIAAIGASSCPRDTEGSYMPAFLVGDGLGRCVARACGAPFFQTNHQNGHIAAALYQSEFPDTDEFLAMHLSGGTTELLRVQKGKIALLGGTSDISFGQLVDRTGVAMGLPFPAGPHLEMLALTGKEGSRLGVAVGGRERLTCSVSGAEAAALRLIQAGETHENVASEVYSFLARTAARMLEAAMELTSLQQVLLAGGVASSTLFRKMLKERIEKRRIDVNVWFAKPELSSDNAVGVARIALKKFMA